MGKILLNSKLSVSETHRCGTSERSPGTEQMGKWRGCSVMLRKVLEGNSPKCSNVVMGTLRGLVALPLSFSDFLLCWGRKDTSLMFKCKKHQGQSVLSQVNGCIYSFSIDGASSLYPF